MTIIAVIGELSLVSLFAYLGTAALSEDTQCTLQERVNLAQAAATHIDRLKPAASRRASARADKAGFFSA